MQVRGREVAELMLIDWIFNTWMYRMYIRFNMLAEGSIS